MMGSCFVRYFDLRPAIYPFVYYMCLVLAQRGELESARPPTICFLSYQGNRVYIQNRGLVIYYKIMYIHTKALDQFRESLRAMLQRDLRDLGFPRAQGK